MTETPDEFNNSDADDLPIRRWAAMTLRLSPKQWRIVNALAASEHISVQALIADAVAASVRRRGLNWPQPPIARNGRRPKDGGTSSSVGGSPSLGVGVSR
jgi:hypothetical protein